MNGDGAAEAENGGGGVGTSMFSGHFQCYPVQFPFHSIFYLNWILFHRLL